MNSKIHHCRIITLFFYKKFIPIAVLLFLAGYKKQKIHYHKHKSYQDLPAEIHELKIINKIISDIPNDKYKASFGLYLSGYDYEEIARIMNLSLRDVEYNIRFIREKLSNNLFNEISNI